jgi:hypothetical protein
MSSILHENEIFNSAKSELSLHISLTSIIEHTKTTTTREEEEEKH